MVERRYSRTCTMSMMGGSDWIPRVEAVEMSWATLATFNSDLLGTQPDHVQSPPMRSLSSKATRAPNVTAKSAAIRPTDPAPMMARSYLSVLMLYAPALSDLT